MPADCLTNPDYQFNMDNIAQKRKAEEKYDVKLSADKTNEDYSTGFESGVQQVKDALKNGLGNRVGGLADYTLSRAIFKNLYPTIDKLMSSVYILYWCVNHVKAKDDSYKTKFHKVHKSHYTLSSILKPFVMEEKKKMKRSI